MLGTADLLKYRDRALKQRLGLREPLLLHIERGEIIQRLADIGMLTRQHLLADRQRALEQRFGIRKAALPLIKRGPSRCQPQTFSILGRCDRGRRSM
ncbi:hypothetical protein ACVWZ4_001942 [Bradyrhizobium sp. USDA 4472]